MGRAETVLKLLQQHLNMLADWPWPIIPRLWYATDLNQRLVQGSKLDIFGRLWTEELAHDVFPYQVPLLRGDLD